MQAIVGRVCDYLNPFQCHFTIPRPVLPRRVPRPPPELPIELWLEIAQFSTHVHRSPVVKTLDPFAARRASTNATGTNTPAGALQTKLALVSVSKAWRQFFLPLLYEHISIRSPMRARLIRRVLEESRGAEHTGHRDYLPGAESHRPSLGYGKWTRYIEIFTHARGTSDIEYLQTVFSILRCCPNLRVLSGHWMHPLPPEFLNALSIMFGASLEGLHWNETRERMNRGPWSSALVNTSATFGFLKSFQALRIVDLRHFKASDPLPDAAEAQRNALPFVQDLIVSTQPWSLAAAAHLSLPRLRTLTIKPSITPSSIDLGQLSLLVKAHGQTLETVDLALSSPNDEGGGSDADSSYVLGTAPQISPDLFLEPDACPNLLSIVFPVTAPPLSGAHVHPSLRRIGLRGVRAEGLYPDRSGRAKEHLEAMSVERYPSLELVQTIDFLVEADGDPLIKDVFIWWAEKFERDGVDFLDGEGVLWAYTDVEGGERVSEDEGGKMASLKRDVIGTVTKEGEGLENVNVDGTKDSVKDPYTTST